MAFEGSEKQSRTLGGGPSTACREGWRHHQESVKAAAQARCRSTALTR